MLARLISRIENGDGKILDALAALPGLPPVPVWGITGPPGAGKSTLVDQLLQHLSSEGAYVAVVAVDPSSPFSGGALLGDRIRMQRHATNPRVFIRSLATRGQMGGLTFHTWEVVALLRHAGFDYILIETVGVGQSEVDIMHVADTTAVVLVPEGGDEVQHIKAGLMEIADLFVVNKADRPGADRFLTVLRKIARERDIPVAATEAHRGQGIAQLVEKLKDMTHRRRKDPHRIIQQRTHQAYRLIASYRTKDLSPALIYRRLKDHPNAAAPDFNLLNAVQDLLPPPSS